MFKDHIITLQHYLSLVPRVPSPSHAIINFDKNVEGEALLGLQVLRGLKWFT